MSCETSFASKQPKLVLSLSKTERLFRLFRIFTETVSFGVLIELKPKNTNQNRLKLNEKAVRNKKNLLRAINMIFSQIKDNNVTYNLTKFQIDSITIEA